MEEANKSQETLNISSSPVTQAASEEERPTYGVWSFEQDGSFSEDTPYSFDMAIAPFSSQQHQQQIQQQLYSFHASGAHPENHIQSYYTHGHSMIGPKYYPTLQGHFQSSFQDNQQLLDRQQQHHHQNQRQQEQTLHQQQQLSPLRSNYFSTPRSDCTIHVAAGKSPTENVSISLCATKDSCVI